MFYLRFQVAIIFRKNEGDDKDTIFLLGNNRLIHHFNNGIESANALRSGYRIITAPTPGMAAANAFYSEPATFDNSVFVYRFYGILRAGGCVPAACRKKRRDTVLVKIHREEHYKV
jgi:hypothetical protein